MTRLWWRFARREGDFRLPKLSKRFPRLFRLHLADKDGERKVHFPSIPGIWGD